MYAVTGRVVCINGFSNPTFLANALASGLVVIAGTDGQTSLTVGNHAYTVMDVYQENGEWFIELRNPWGMDNYEEGDYWGNPDDGIIVLSWTNFQGYYDFNLIGIS